MAAALQQGCLLDPLACWPLLGQGPERVGRRGAFQECFYVVLLGRGASLSGMVCLPLARVGRKSSGKTTWGGIACQTQAELEGPELRFVANCPRGTAVEEAFSGTRGTQL